MAKKLEHQINVEVREGTCYGTMDIHHGSLKHNRETTGLEVKWTCNVDGVELDTLLQEAARNISVRMANIREFDFEEFNRKRSELDGAVVEYDEIKSWTTKGSKGRKKMEDMEVDELEALQAKIEALLAAKVGK